MGGGTIARDCGVCTGMGVEIVRVSWIEIDEFMDAEDVVDDECVMGTSPVELEDDVEAL